ncbi:hypothetical protein [Pseudomonas yamanorum]
MFKKYNVLVIALSLLAMTPSFSMGETPRPSIDDKVQAYSSNDGTQVWTLRVGERSARQALVQVSGIDHDWDKRIQKMNVEKTSKDVRYATQVNGEPYVVLILNNGAGELYLPGELSPMRVSYDSKLSETGNAEYFLTDYLEQSQGK